MCFISGVLLHHGRHSPEPLTKLAEQSLSHKVLQKEISSWAHMTMTIFYHPSESSKTINMSPGSGEGPTMSEFVCTLQCKSYTSLLAGFFPMTTVQNGRRYVATVVKGKDVQCQGDNSDVQLHIIAGCPKRAHYMEVRTDLSNFASIIPDNECFIAPVIDVLAPARTKTSAYVLTIPHCLSEGDDRNNVKVRMWHENRKPVHAIVDVPPRDKCTDGILFYDIDHSFIKLHTAHFCKVVCTICQTPLHCLDRATSFFFGKFENIVEDSKEKHEVEIRPYFCSIPYAEIKDFQQVRQGHIIAMNREQGIHAIFPISCCLDSLHHV